MFKKIISILKERIIPAPIGGGADFEIMPHRDWFILIIAAVIIGTALVFIAVYLFFIINSNELVDIGAVGGGFESVHKAQLQTVLQSFSEKENEYEILFNTEPRIIDPSL